MAFKYSSPIFRKRDQMIGTRHIGSVTFPCVGGTKKCIRYNELLGLIWIATSVVSIRTVQFD